MQFHHAKTSGLEATSEVGDCPAEAGEDDDALITVCLTDTAEPFDQSRKFGVGGFKPLEGGGIVANLAERLDQGARNFRRWAVILFLIEIE